MESTRYLDALTLEPIDDPGERATKIGDDDAPCYLVGPAFFDPQVNGFAGVDFTDPDLTREQLESAVLAVRRAGCSHFLLTLVTAGDAFLEDQFRRLAALFDQSPLTREAIPGFHLEGPFISPEQGFRGAHPEEHARPPDADAFDRWQAASGNRIRIVTLAPEWPEGIAFIRHATEAGVFVCLGHTDASRDRLIEAVRAGARMMVHLGNGCPLQMHRHDNIIQRVLAVPELLASLIPDGVHLPPFVLSNLARHLGPDRLVFTTDAVAPAGSPSGRYQIGDYEVTVGDDRVVMHADGEHFFGSALTMIQGFRNAIAFGGLDPRAAWRAWTLMRDLLLPDLDPPRIMVPLETIPAR